MSTTPESLIGDEPDLDESGEIVETPELETPETPETPEGAAAPVVPPPSFTPEALAAAFKAAGIGAPAQQVQASPQPKLTAEEAKKLLKYPELGKEWIAKFGNLDTQEAAVAELLQKVSEHSYTLAEARARDLEERLMQRYAPMEQYTQQQRDAENWKKFDTKYPALAKPELRPVLTSVLQAIASSGYVPTSPDDIFDKLAQGALPVIQQFNPQFTLGTPPASSANVATKNNGRGGTIAANTPGGGGANGGVGAGSGGKVATIKSLFK